ncbi:MAG TPA: AsmA family protein [Terriglobales bacterium]|nr:AsmA family protein [Terriglobales bacterium]
MRKLGIAILVIIVLIVAAALIVPRVIDINHYRPQIQAELQKRLGRSVALGEMSLGLLPPSFQVANPVVSDSPQFNTGKPFATAEKLSVKVAFWPLLHKQVEVKSLELVRPHVELVRNAQGVWNFATLGENAPTSTPSAPATPAKRPAPAATPAPAKPQPQTTPENKQPAGGLTVANLVITDGQVAITDQQKHQSRAVYDHIDLDVSNFAPDQQFSIKATAHLPGAGSQAVSLEGKGGPLKQADIINTPFDGSIKLDQVAVSAAEKFLNSQALRGIEAQISGNATVRNFSGKLSSAGNIHVTNARIRSVDVGYPIALKYDVTDDLVNDIIQIQKGDIDLGSTPVTISGTLNTKPSPSQVDLKLTAENASIQDAARLASAFGVAFGKQMNVQGQVNANIQAKGAANKPALNGNLSARNLVISGKEVPQPVKAQSVELTLTPDAIRSNNFTATAGSTNVNVNFALQNYTGNNSTIDAALRAPNAQIADLLSMAKAAGISAVDGMSGNGLLTLDVHARGPVKNMSALVFNGTGKIQNASLKPPSLTQPVHVRNVDLGFSQNSANLRNLAASVGQTNATGNLTLKNFAVPQVQFALNADKVNVAELQQLMAPQQTPAKKSADAGFWQLVPRAEAQAAPQPGIVTKMTGAGTISVGSVQYNDLLLNNVHSNVALDRGVIKMNPVTADLYGGKETGAVTVDLRPAQPVYSANLKTTKVDANKLLSSVSSLKQTLYGLLSANVNASFSSTTADAIARSLNGRVAMDLNNGRLMNVDLLHELASVGKFLGNGIPNAPQGFTNIVQLTGNFDINNGIAQTNNLKAAIEGGTLAAAGAINLASQALDMRLTAVLNKALSQRVGGTQIGGFMNTALANNNGELVMPVLVTGTFQHPQIAPDVQQIAQMKLHNLLPTTSNPGALTSGILGKILGNKGQGANRQQQSPGGALGGILGALGGKQQQQQQPQQPTSPAGQPTPASTPQPQNQNPVGNILNQVLGGKKPSPTPTPK